jgi:DNA helicase HerA-like ATPase
MIVHALLSYIVDAKLGNGPERIRETPIVVVIDEAHNYLKDTNTVRLNSIVERVTDIAREGRRPQLGLVAVSQNPTDIDEEIRSQINSTVLLRHEPDAARELDVPRQYLRRVSEFDAGRGLLDPPGEDWLEIEGFRQLVGHE